MQDKIRFPSSFSYLCIKMNLSSGLLRWSSLQSTEGQRHTKFHLVGFENSKTPSNTTLWPIDHREDYRSCTWPFYTLCLKYCTLTYNAVRTICSALFKPPQRRQGPDLRPLWLLVGNPLAIIPDLASRRAEHSLPYSDVTKYIFAI